VRQLVQQQLAASDASRQLDTVRHSGRGNPPTRPSTPALEADDARSTVAAAAEAEQLRAELEWRWDEVQRVQSQLNEAVESDKAGKAELERLRAQTQPPSLPAPAAPRRLIGGVVRRLLQEQLIASEARRQLDADRYRGASAATNADDGGDGGGGGSIEDLAAESEDESDAPRRLAWHPGSAAPSHNANQMVFGSYSTSL